MTELRENRTEQPKISGVFDVGVSRTPWIQPGAAITFFEIYGRADAFSSPKVRLRCASTCAAPATEVACFSSELGSFGVFREDRGRKCAGT